MPAASFIPGMQLSLLLPEADRVPDVLVEGLASDSRAVDDGFLFLATPGHATHGMAFAREAVERGAVAIAYDPDGLDSPPPSVSVPAVAVPGLRRQLGAIANRFYDTPSATLDVYGVTGTNGKTTVAWLLAACQQSLGLKSAYVGTLGAGLGTVSPASGLTTPGTVELHGLLAD